MSMGMTSPYISSSNQIKAGLLFRELANAESDGTSGTLTASDIRPSDLLRVTLVGGAPSGVGTLRLRFNGDTGGNYGYDNVAANAANSSYIELINAVMNDPFNYSGQIGNISGEEHTGRWIGSYGNPPGAPTQIDCAGGWSNTGQITSVTAYLSANNFASGTKLFIEGI